MLTGKIRNGNEIILKLTIRFIPCFFWFLLFCVSKLFWLIHQLTLHLILLHLHILLIWSWWKMVFSCKKLGLESRARPVSSASYQQVRGRSLEQPAIMQWTEFRKLADGNLRETDLPKPKPIARLSWAWWEQVAKWKCYLQGFDHWEHLTSSPLY